MLKYLGRVAATLGGLKLLQDASIANLKGLFADWFSAYESFIGFLNKNIFFVFNYWGPLISATEVNTLVLGTILASSVMRSSYLSGRSRPEWKAEAASSFFAIIVSSVLIPFVISLTFHTKYSVYVVLTWTSILLITWAIQGDEKDKILYPDTHVVRREILNVCIYLAIIIGANYIIFG